MDTVIGLGGAGCSIAELFKKYPQYSVYKIDVGEDGENCYDFSEQNSPELYERNTPNMEQFLRRVDGDVLFVVAGGGKISGASLRILQQLKNCNINILYIKPDNKDLNNTGYLQNKLTYNVFQEYARSGLFERIFIISNSDLENAIGDVSILDYKKKLNEYLTSIIHYINVFNNTEPVVDNREEPRVTSRIATIGVHDLKTDDEIDLFPIENVTDKCYYYAINENALKTDGKLLKKIKEHISKNDVRASYEIHSTKHPESFCYYISYSNSIQPLDSTD